MDRAQRIKEIKTIFIEILDNEDFELKETTGAKDVEGWDSLTHIQLVVALEKYFKVKFTSSEIQAWKNVGNMMDSLEKRLPSITGS
jgi:acyl carrier protein